MRKLYLTFSILIASLLFISCQDLSRTDILQSDNEGEFIELSNDASKKIVLQNSSRIELVLEEYFDEDLFYNNDDVITKDIFNEEKDTEEVADLLRRYREGFRALIDQKHLEPLLREYVYYAYTSMHGGYLSTINLQTRFEVTEQSPKHFEATFLQLADEAHNPIPVQYTVTYVKKFGEWLLYDYEIKSMEDESLELTVHDMKEYFRNVYNSQAELLDTREDYLILEIAPDDEQEPYVVAINIHDSSFSVELAAEYEY